MLFKRKHVPTCRIYPLQYRKIWKKLLTFEVGAGDSTRKILRPVFGTLFSVTGIFVLIILTTPTQGTVNFVALLAPLLAVFFGLIFFVIIYEWLYLWTYYYDFDDHLVHIRKGVIIRREISVPYDRIQDIYFDQDLMDHVFHLYDLYVATASNTSFDTAHIDGLNRHNGLILQNMLFEKMREARGEEPKAANTLGN
ncbi:MAG: PH domain-containing protein [Patescibacteria group bacterium]|jgi:membrane protein YdbS with pleckstrin-like domain